MMKVSLGYKGKSDRELFLNTSVKLSILSMLMQKSSKYRQYSKANVNNFAKGKQIPYDNDLVSIMTQN